MTSIEKYKKNVSKSLNKNKQQIKLLYNSIFNGVYQDRIIDELLNPLILEEDIDKTVLSYYDAIKLLDTKKNRLKFLDTVIDLFDHLPIINKEVVLYQTLDINDCSKFKSLVNKHYSKIFLDLSNNFNKEYTKIYSLDEYLENKLLDINFSKLNNKTYKDEKESLLNKKFCLIIMKLPKKSKLLPLVYQKIDINENHLDNENDIKFVLPPLYKWKYLETKNLYDITKEKNLIDSVRILKYYPNIDVHYYQLVI